MYPFLPTTIPVPLSHQTFRIASSKWICEGSKRPNFYLAPRNSHATFSWADHSLHFKTVYSLFLHLLEWVGQLSAPLVSGDCSYHRSVFSTGWPVDFYGPFYCRLKWGLRAGHRGSLGRWLSGNEREEKSKSGPFKTSTMSRLPRAKKWVSERIWDRVTFPSSQKKIKRK